MEEPKVLPSGKIKRIHVNQHVIRANRNNESEDPIFTIKTSNSNYYGHSVSIIGPSQVIYSANKPLSCGAHAWIETTAAVEIEIAN